MQISAGMSAWMICTGIISGLGRPVRRSATGMTGIRKSEIRRRRSWSALCLTASPAETRWSRPIILMRRPGRSCRLTLRQRRCWTGRRRMIWACGGIHWSGTARSILRSLQRISRHIRAGSWRARIRRSWTRSALWTGRRCWHG